MSSPPAPPAMPTAQQQPMSAVLPSGDLNVDLIQRSVQNDVALEEKYRAEDAMKKRAIHSCQNYDEFRNLVKAAQLKPVNRSDMASLFNGGGSLSSSNGTQRSGGAAMNKAFSGSGSSGGMNGSSFRGGLGGGLKLYSTDASAAAAERGRRVAQSSSQSTKSKNASDDEGGGGGGGGGSLFDQSTPAELDGLDWNQKAATKKSKGKKSKSKKKKKSGTKASSTSSSSGGGNISPLQFEKEWKRTCTDPPSTARYLLRTESSCSASSSITASPLPDHQGTKRRLILQPEDVPQSVFKVELSCDVMGDIVAALAYLCRLALSIQDVSALNDEAGATDDCINEALTALCSSDAGSDGCTAATTLDVGEMALNLRASFVYRWMDAMTQCGRFGLNVSFLNEMQMEDVEIIFATLERKCGGDEEGYEEEDVLRLRGLYNARIM